MATVRLLEVPVRLRAKSAEHGEALLREMTLLTTAQADRRHVPARLLELADELDRESGPFTAAQAAALEDAVAQGMRSFQKSSTTSR